MTLHELFEKNDDQSKLMRMALMQTAGFYAGSLFLQNAVTKHREMMVEGMGQMMGLDEAGKEKMQSDLHELAQTMVEGLEDA